LKRVALRILIAFFGMAVGLAIGGLVAPVFAAAPSQANTSFTVGMDVTPNMSTTTCLTSTSKACYAAAYIDNGSAWGGGYVDTQVVNLSALSGSWMNEELWVAGQGGDNISNWVEMGYTDGGPNCPGGLQWFWTYSLNGGLEPIVCGTATPPTVGSWHTLEIQEVAADTWDVYLDGAYVDQYTMPSGWSYQVTEGLEYHYGDETSFNGTAYFNASEVRTTTCCTWDYWPTAQPWTPATSMYVWNWSPPSPPYSNGFNKEQ
jgi:hypothetical protein